MLVRAAAVAIALLVLPACGGGDEQDSAETPAADEIPAAAPPPVIEAVPPAVATTGLTPLPTAQRVVDGIPLGRDDPFLPAPALEGTAELVAAQLEAEAILATMDPDGGLSQQDRAAVIEEINSTFEGLEITGFIRSRGRQRVLVDFNGQTGDLAVGYVGGAGRRLLPDGWTLESIRADTGVVIFRNGNRVAERRIL
ncbi:hypothetical protein EVJ50_14285 [Synechococcus sp. RSCCF101]|uniref:hypothetical protein n=1 Tax=Synechococcus sp. RSCCF101 TaxID=2511069 RepID=UPI0012489BC5|nr:hypothetical protein [Synechococcus sp. RSCCF101]QEY33227.1 hypothetical protein EVJ50_14285 [Synechococcus sp. RSCCF101]